MENSTGQKTIPPFENNLIIKSTDNFEVRYGFRDINDKTESEQRVFLTPTNKDAEKLLVDFANRNGVPLSTREVDTDGKKNQVMAAMFHEDPKTLLEKLNKSGNTEGETFGSGVPSLTSLENKLQNPANQEQAFNPNLEIKTKDILLTAAKDIASKSMDSLGRTLLDMKPGVIPNAVGSAILGIGAVVLWHYTGKSIEMEGGVAEFIKRDYFMPGIKWVLPMMASVTTLGSVIYAGFARDFQNKDQTE